MVHPACVKSFRDNTDDGLVLTFNARRILRGGVQHGRLSLCVHRPLFRTARTYHSSRYPIVLPSQQP